MQSVRDPFSLPRPPHHSSPSSSSAHSSNEMFVQPAENGKTPSYSEIINRPEPVYKILEALPFELVEVVVSHVSDLKSLRSLARVNKLFQELAEPYIYTNVLIQKGIQARRLAAAIRSNPIRATWIRNLQNACLANSFNGLSVLPDIVPLMTRLENLIIETPDCNAFSPEDRSPWITQQAAYNQIFLKASQPNANLLPNLLSCTLHFVDKNFSLYPLALHSIIFLHPTLESLTVSCASIGPPRQLHPLLLQNELTHTTRLQTLSLIECDFHPQGLYHLLRLPCRLTSLTLTEATHYAYYARDRRYSGLNTATILHPLSPLQAHLHHLCIARLRNDPNLLFSLSPLDLTPFPALTTMEYAHVQGPRPTVRPAVDYCEPVHRSGPRLNTGSPTTTSLTYSDIPPQWWERGIQFFTCAFRNKISHGIENLRCLTLVLVDHELMIAERWGRVGAVEEGREQAERRERIERVKRLIRGLGELGRKKEVGVRVVVDWLRPNGCTIPPYLMGEFVPERRAEYDNGVGVEGVEEIQGEREPGSEDRIQYLKEESHGCG